MGPWKIGPFFLILVLTAAEKSLALWVGIISHTALGSCRYLSLLTSPLGPSVAMLLCKHVPYFAPRYTNPYFHWNLCAWQCLFSTWHVLQYTSLLCSAIAGEQSSPVWISGRILTRPESSQWHCCTASRHHNIVYVEHSKPGKHNKWCCHHHFALYMLFST